MINFSQLEGFDWDEGNINKSWLKHEVGHRECEEIFKDNFLLILLDTSHSQQEIRYNALGKTKNNRFLFLSFTVRDNLIRIISARDVNKKERKIYDQKQQKTI